MPIEEVSGKMPSEEKADPPTESKTGRFLMKPICPVVCAAITAMTVGLVTHDERCNGQLYQVCTPASNLPDQPHPPHSGYTPGQPTIQVERGVSGTNTSGALSTTTGPMA
jgi:hypothetical protein